MQLPKRKGMKETDLVELNLPIKVLSFYWVGDNY